VNDVGGDGEGESFVKAQRFEDAVREFERGLCGETNGESDQR
jgi:hypothetical protein